MSWSLKGVAGSIGTALAEGAKSVEGTIPKDVSAVAERLTGHGPTQDAFEPAPPSSQDKYHLLTEPLFQGKPTDNFDQGSIGDCYVLSAMAAVSVTSPQTIENSIHANGDGTYTVTFHEPPGTALAARFGAKGLQTEGVIDEGLDIAGLSPGTKTVQVTVDGQVPVDASGKPVASSSPELWPQIYEKAMAKLMDGYPNMGNGGIPALTLQMITGKPVKTHVNLLDSSSDIYSEIAKASANQQPITASTPKSPGGGLVGDHCYAVLGAVTQNGGQFIQVRNPWGGSNNGVQLVPLATFKSSFEEVDVGSA